MSGLLGLAGCSAIGAYFWRLAEAGGGGGQHAWLVLAGALATVLSYGAGIAPVTFTYLVELLPNSTRAITINMVLLYFSLVQFCAVHFFPAMERGLGSHGTFWLFAAVNALQVLLATFALPETRGLTLEEIQHKFFAARRRSSGGSGPQSGEERAEQRPEDVERGQVNAAAELEDEDRVPEDRRTVSERSGSAQTEDSPDSRRSSGVDTVYPAGCFV